MTFKKFPSIEQFRNIITNVRQHCNKHEKPLPKLTFKGTVKVHGTNAGVGYDPQTGKLWCQSRERIITPFDDNAGFAKFVNENQWYFQRFLQQFAAGEAGEKVILFGEWAGPGIQKGVGVSELSMKMFFPFDIRIINEAMDVESRITLDELSDYQFPITDIPATRPINTFKTWEIDIDFNEPQAVQNKLVELTMAVEAECPVAKEFGISGIGEGIVWEYAPLGMRFKVKGEKHSTSNVRTVAVISEEDLARMKTADSFVDTVATENRLAQGLDKLREMGLPLEMRSIGEYLKWVGQDILKEEMDLIEAAALDRKEIMPRVTAKAKKYFMEAMNAAVAA